MKYIIGFLMLITANLAMAYTLPSDCTCKPIVNNQLSCSSCIAISPGAQNCQDQTSGPDCKIHITPRPDPYDLSNCSSANSTITWDENNWEFNCT